VFEVGFSELLLICVIALIVLGPQKLPGLARQVGQWMGRARSMARQFREQLEDEASAEEFLMDDGTSTRKSANNTSTNTIARPAAVAGTVPGAVTAEAALTPDISGTALTGIPPDDDFAHHDADPLYQADANNSDGHAAASPDAPPADSSDKTPG
jgi:sec-independent protein translocase protein TatB